MCSLVAHIAVILGIGNLTEFAMYFSARLNSFQNYYYIPILCIYRVYYHFS